MVFSKEDNQAWESSEVMLELEKMAEDVFKDTPIEAYEPIEEDNWEDEKEQIDLKKCECAPGTATLYDGKICALCGGIKEENTFKNEIQEAYGQAVVGNLEKIASDLAEQSKIKVTYRIEQTINKLKDILKGGSYND